MNRTAMYQVQEIGFYKSFRAHVTAMEIEATGPWMRLWDWALGYGVRGTKVCQQLLRLVARPVFGDRICYRCNSIR